MRNALACLAGFVLLLPLSASAVDPPDCARLIRQFQHYKGMQDRADELGNEMWADRMEQQVDLIEGRLDARCPEYTADKRAVREAARQIAKLIKIGAKAALTFFTAGAM